MKFFQSSPASVRKKEIPQSWPLKKRGTFQTTAQYTWDEGLAINFNSHFDAT